MQDNEYETYNKYKTNQTQQTQTKPLAAMPTSTNTTVSLYEQCNNDIKSDSIKNSNNTNVNVKKTFNNYANICNDSIITNYRNWQTTPEELRQQRECYES